MADQNHVSWLHEGVEAWNARRSSTDFVPDLSGVRLDPAGAGLESLTDLKSYNFEKANLQDAILIGVDFSESNLANADLRRVSACNVRFCNAMLGGANLHQARLFGADLSSAFLRFADLTETELELANLTDADMRFAKVSGARLNEAILARANTLAAKLWQAVLFERDDTSANLHSQGDPVAVGSVSNLLEAIRKLDTRPLYFRGEQRCGWRLMPSVFRQDLAKVEHKLLNDLISRRPEELGGTKSALEQLQIAQHYGLKTRLLDITKNPLVALYFACEPHAEYDNEDGRLHVVSVPESLIRAFNSDTISIVTNFVKLSLQDKSWLLGRHGRHPQQPYSARFNFDEIMARLYQKIREEKPHFSERIDMKDLYGVFVVEPQQSDERVRAQSGAFLVSAFREEFDYQEAEDWNGAVRPYRHCSLNIPRESKKSILEDLRVVGITRQTLFPGLESSAKEVMRRCIQ